MTSRELIESITKGGVEDREQLVDGEQPPAGDAVSENGSGASRRPMEVSPLQLDANRCLRSPKGSPEGLKVVIVTCICFAVSVTVALIITIYVGPPQVPTHGGVVSDDERCSALGVRLLKQGGSAVDAAVATVLCVGVLKPELCGIGGGGVMLVHFQKTKSRHVIDFTDSVPSGWTKGDAAGASVGVPGMLRGLELAQNKFGKLSWTEVVSPVAELAGNVSQGMKEFLQQVAESGADAFYTGNMASKVVEKVNNAGGAMSTDDLSDYKALEIEPVESSVFGVTVETTPAPTDGPFLLLMLNIMNNLTSSGVTSWNSTDLFHYIVEAMKFTYGVRSQYADGLSLEDNGTEIFSREFAASLAGRIDPNSTYVDSRDYDASNAEPMLWNKTGSSHIAVIGPSDDIVSVTVSLNDVKGSGLQAPLAGFYLNNHLSNFDAKMKETRNRRTPTYMTPTVVYKPHSPCAQRLAVGAAHGSFGLAALAEMIINIVGKNLDISPAVNMSRLYDDVGSDTIFWEESKQASKVVSMLETKGHTQFQKIKVDQNLVNIAAKTNEIVYGQADPRNRAGSANVY